ncbi:hypothetical protein SCA03_29210 [Streptomyces cacaoi]|uniref:Uncharacterized protein n=1 Tax=Streptomyces cacaoi TaxID=1898 RepID=A0A4Y3R2X4_STRCI|nr:hypothetical protein SCA03_29210 [Streptomyces cacaoi]
MLLCHDAVTPRSSVARLVGPRRLPHGPAAASRCNRLPHQPARARTQHSMAQDGRKFTAGPDGFPGFPGARLPRIPRSPAGLPGTVPIPEGPLPHSEEPPAERW